MYAFHLHFIFQKSGSLRTFLRLLPLLRLCKWNGDLHGAFQRRRSSYFLTHLAVHSARKAAKKSRVLFSVADLHGGRRNWLTVWSSTAPNEKRAAHLTPGERGRGNGRCPAARARAANFGQSAAEKATKLIVSVSFTYGSKVFKDGDCTEKLGQLGLKTILRFWPRSSLKIKMPTPSKTISWLRRSAIKDFPDSNYLRR
ncbi:hypothetical protein CASFOL_008019 [Castilleja foliolosa]|uniref:Uncharacterized protein n=1 Tax=Castilleja foliolosa TaxID=1961234 RepID=A0ABD3E1U3_9LAMI